MSQANQIKAPRIVLNPKDATRFMDHTLKAGLVAFLKGSPGIGKSDIARQTAKANNLKFVDFRLAQCDPTDLNGFPRFDEKTGRSTYMPMTTWPLKGDPLPINEETGQPYDGWYLFFDELPAAAPAVQAAAYKILLDRKVADFDLHPKAHMGAAGNLVTDNAVAEDMSTALQSRLIHATLEVKLEDWLRWAVHAGIDPRITSFLQWKPGQLYQFNPDHTDDTFACPRTWEFASKGLKGLDLVNDQVFSRAVLVGTISEGPAREFIAFCNFFSKLPTMAEIAANPKGVAVPEEPGVLYALTGALAGAMDQTNIGPLFEYMSRIPLEYQVITLRSAIPRNREIAQNPAVKQWCVANASALF